MPADDRTACVGQTKGMAGSAADHLGACGGGSVRQPETAQDLQWYRVAVSRSIKGANCRQNSPAPPTTISFSPTPTGTGAGGHGTPAGRTEWAYAIALREAARALIRT